MQQLALPVQGTYQFVERAEMRYIVHNDLTFKNRTAIPADQFLNVSNQRVAEISLFRKYIQHQEFRLVW